MRKFARITSVCALLLFATLASAQQVDLFAGGNTLFSTSNDTRFSGLPAPSGKRRPLPQRRFRPHLQERTSATAERLAFRYKQAFYNGYQKYRPILYDFNAVLAPHFNPFPARISKRTSTIFTAGAGGQTVLYYNPYGNCVYGNGCTTHLNSNHFLLHVSGGFNYRAWRNLFVRPEADYYYIINNTSDFHSNSVLRLGVSVGYTFHTD